MEQAIEEQLALMGYTPPNWDNFQINKPPISATSDLASANPTRKQRFVLKAWPKIEGFFLEDEDPIVISHAETIKKNGLVTRVFRLYFDTENGRYRWQFVLEKRVDTNNGLHLNGQDIRQLWAKTSPDLLEEIEEKFVYARSFDTTAQSSKYKTNTEDGSARYCQKIFLRDIKGILTDAFQSTEPFSVSNQYEDETTKSSSSFFKGKAFEFEENGHQIVWTVSIRHLDKSEIPPNTWCVKVSTDTDTTKGTLQVQGIQKFPNSQNSDQVSNNDHNITLKLETEISKSNPFLSTEDLVEKSEDMTVDSHTVEENILEFINFVWPKIRNFYLESEDSDVTSASAVTTVLQNGLPTKVLELHFDTLNERNRWRVLFEIGIKSGNSPSKSWACLNPEKTSNYFESRVYGSYEKRGTSSKNEQDANDYFKGVYKRWFLSEVQWKLVKCFAQVGHFSHNTIDTHSFEFGKDLEFTDQDDQVTWSVSVQKAIKYPLFDSPANVWCYGLTNKYLSSSTDVPQGQDGLVNSTDKETRTPLEEQAQGLNATAPVIANQVPVQTDRGSLPGLKTPPKTKSKSRIRNLAKTIVRPVLKKPSWLGGGSSNRNSRQTARENISKDSETERGLNDNEGRQVVEAVKVDISGDQVPNTDTSSDTVNNPNQATDNETAEYF